MINSEHQSGKKEVLNWLEKQQQNAIYNIYISCLFCTTKHTYINKYERSKVSV